MELEELTSPPRIGTVGTLTVASQIALIAPACFAVRTAPDVRLPGLWPRCSDSAPGGGDSPASDGAAAGNAWCRRCAPCLPTSTVCPSRSGTKSWQARSHLIEKRAVTSDSAGGVTAAAAVHLPAEQGGLLLTGPASELSGPPGRPHSAAPVVGCIAGTVSAHALHEGAKTPLVSELEGLRQVPQSPPAGVERDVGVKARSSEEHRPNCAIRPNCVGLCSLMVERGL